MGVKVGFKRVLALLGKREEKVAVVFGISPGPCHEAVAHVKRGAPDIPVWLFSTPPPLPQTTQLCERVFVGASPACFLKAQVQLWPHWVAIAVGTWTAEHGHWLVKLAPFFLQPFRVLLLNSWGGFFAGTPGLVLLHGSRYLLAAALSGWIFAKELSVGCAHSRPVRRTQDLAAGYWALVSYHIWRSSPVRRAQDIGSGLWRLISYHIWRSGPVRRAGDLACGWAIFGLATLLRWLNYPYRRWFAWMHGQKRLYVGETSVGRGFDHFVQHGHIWDASCFSEFIESTNARWIYWEQRLEGFAPVEMGEISPLFADPRTFAVARQDEVRGWKPALLPMTPFRHLQRGTVAQVLGPVSRGIWIDRAKVAALGIPSTKLTQTAWMLLFWKAAAAGWRCYSEPALERSGGQQPDFPEQETEFLLRLLADPSVRRLGPQEADLARGTISFSPSRQLPLRSDRVKVLVVSPFLPYPLSHGGAVRIFNLCRGLSDRVDFVLIAIREAHETVEYERLHEVFRQVYTVDIDEKESKAGNLPKQVRASQSASLRALITDICQREGPDLLQVEFTHMAGYRDCAPKVPAILVEHDLTFNLYAQLSQAERTPAAREEQQRWLRFEQHWLSAYDGVWTMSESDRRGAIGAGSDPERTFVVSNGVDLKRFAPGVLARAGDAPEAFPEVLYVGSFRHRPNIIGFQRLCEDVMPRVWRRLPNARLSVVAGPEHESFWKALTRPGEHIAKDPRIRIHGYVEDLNPLYRQAAVAVVPLEVSAGTNIKVLEAMASGKAVVTTPIGCEGLGLKDGHDAFIRQNWEEFAEAVSEALVNPDARSRAGARARRTVEARYSWDAAVEQAYASYMSLIGRSDSIGAESRWSLAP